jgi:hypothetical protein
MPSQATTAAGALGIALNWTANFIMASRLREYVMKSTDNQGASFLPVQKALSRGGKSGEGNVFYLLAGHCLLAFVAIRISYAAYDRAKAH